jgi:hypothetical protein
MNTHTNTRRYLVISFKKQALKTSIKASLILMIAAGMPVAIADESEPVYVSKMKASAAAKSEDLGTGNVGFKISIPEWNLVSGSTS